MNVGQQQNPLFESNIMKIAKHMVEHLKEFEREIRIYMKEKTLKPSLLFNWVMFSGGFSVQY